MASSLIHGSRLELYINNRPYAEVTSFSWTSGTGHKEIRGIDVQSPQELGPTTTSVSGEIGLLRSGRSGGLQQAGIVARQDVVSREKYCTILLFDKVANLPVFRADHCKVLNESWGVPAGKIMTGQLSFAGIMWNNEAPEPKK